MKNNFNSNTLGSEKRVIQSIGIKVDKKNYNGKSSIINLDSGREIVRVRPLGGRGTGD